MLHYRRRRVDPDGLVVKHHLDGIVDAGLIPDDAAKYVASIEHVQHLVATEDDEHMVFVFMQAP